MIAAAYADAILALEQAFSYDNTYQVGIVFNKANGVQIKRTTVYYIILTLLIFHLFIMVMDKERRERTRGTRAGDRHTMY